jgi:ABC-type sugar transport system ATPase subunit
MSRALDRGTSTRGRTAAAGEGADPEVYAATGVSMTFGATRALVDARFACRSGQVHALLGANGAGKSTLVKILAGVQEPDAGELRLDGAPVRFGSGREAAAAGVATVSQELNLFPDLTVLANLFLMREPLRGGVLTHGPEMRRLAAPVLEAVGLSPSLLDRTVGSLSLGSRQLVEIARALLQDPRVLILDEPTSALKAADTRRVLEVVKDLRRRDVAIVMVSHFLEDVFAVADVVTVLRNGRVVHEATPLAELTPDAVVESMLGKALAAGAAEDGAARSFPIPAAPAGLGPLVLDGAASRGTLEPLTLRAEPGEVVGLAGLEGSGASETLRLVYGQMPLTAGTVTLPSGRGGPSSMYAAARAGIAYVPADRKADGLIVDQPISENVNMVTAGPLRRLGFLPRERVKRERAAAWREPLGLVTRSIGAPVGALSGGNQQKVVFAKWLEAAPSLVLLDDPTRGVDVGAKADMMNIVRAVADSGRVVLYASTDLEEMAQLCDRVVVFYRRRAIGELRAPLAEHELFEAVSRGVTNVD